MNNNKSKKIKLLRIIILVITIILMVGITIYLFPVMKNLSTYDGQIDFKEKVNNSGIYGFLSLIVLPGEPLEILAGMCYGAVGGTLFTLFSVAITTTVIFMITRKFGKELIYDSFGKEKIDKIENSKVFQNPKNIEFIFAICFAIVGTPKDLLTYIGALFPIKPFKFILIATFCRFPSIISSTIVGQYFSRGNWKVSIIVYLITFVFTLIIIALVKFIDKEKITERALKELQWFTMLYNIDNLNIIGVCKDIKYML